MGQTRVDLQRLLEDLRDAYAGALEETILTEVVANSLDSGAQRVSFLTDPAQSALVAIDDGRGMARRELARYHDIATSGKTRGEGIGFAGVGIKLGLLVCEEVLTETRRPDAHIATRWRLATRQRAPWRWVEPRGLVERAGTAVCLKLKNPLSPLLDAAFVEATLRAHFEPLLDPAFDEALAPHYPAGVELSVNGRPLERRSPPQEGERAPLAVQLPRKRRPAGHGFLIRSPEPLPEPERGVAVSTLGKVIRRGWDWLGLVPATPERIAGLVEVPALAESLTLNKSDFLRAGARGIAYLAYRKAIQQAVSAQLAAWGEGRDSHARARRAARPLERDLEAVLLGLAEDFPALSPLVEQRAGGQKRLPTGGPGGLGAGAAATERAPAAADDRAPAEPEPAPRSPDAEPGAAEAAARRSQPPAAGGPGGPRRPIRYGLSIQFEERPDVGELARLVGPSVLVNTAHAAYRRALASRSDAYHVAVAVAMALAPLAAEPAAALGFLSAFLRNWGEALGRDKRRRGAKP